MYLPRIIPVLLLKGNGLVKTTKFRKPRYIGDSINAVKIFNDLKADELVILDIDASKNGKTINNEVIKNIGDEAYMPFAVGGGITQINQIEAIIKAGAEKVVLNTISYYNPEIIKKASQVLGSQSIVVSIDTKKTLLGKYECRVKSGTVNTGITPEDYAKKMEDLGVGEIIINSIDRDGTMAGYDLNIIKRVSDVISIPVVACGGAGDLTHLKSAYIEGNAHALAAGSLFIYHGPRKAVLINYPQKAEIYELMKEK